MQIPRISSVAIIFCLVDLGLAGKQWKYHRDKQYVAPVREAFIPGRERTASPGQEYIGPLAGQKRKTAPEGPDGEGPLLTCEVHLFEIGPGRKKLQIGKGEDIWPFPGRAIFEQNKHRVVVDVDDRCDPTYVRGFIKGKHRLEFWRTFLHEDEGIKKIKYTCGLFGSKMRRRKRKRKTKTHLPPALSDATIRNLSIALGLPEPVAISRLSATAEYHGIYLLRFDAGSVGHITPPLQTQAIDGSATLVLRVSGRHLPGLKTRNEVGCMAWVRSNTTIPVPAVIRYDDTENNALNHEFTLLEKAPGVSVDTIYETLNDAQKRHLVEQLTGYIVQLYDKQWQEPCIGGLVPASDDGAKPVPGPVVEETFWQQPDIDKLWPGETVDTLNATEGPFTGYMEYITANVERYIYAIERHNSLVTFRDLVPRLRAFIAAIRAPEQAKSLNDTTYIVAHKDMHFANIMCDPTQSQPDKMPITAVLDWEFSGITPANRWNPSRAFLWNGQQNDASKEEKERLFDLFKKLLKERAPYILDEMEPNKTQGAMQTVQSFLRAIVEVCPRGQCADKVGSWRATLEASLEAFGV
ncbi:hypothetical protein PspLS_00085 [Pyricularia sp. CBS 133598]|nr:hypothetical protein PspLS_00085 [Pyricularia sp. CBS 133598]